MPGPIREYTIADWKRLRPLIQMLKTLRYRWINQLYGRRAAGIWQRLRVLLLAVTCL